MKGRLRLALGVYTRLLRLYPASFRQEFGEEMADAFRAAAEESFERGPAAFARLCWRELAHFPGSVLEENRSGWIEQWRARKMERNERSFSAEEDQRRAPASWGETLLGIGPILLWALVQALGELSAAVGGGLVGAFMAALILCGIFAGFILFGVGLAKGFPRWSFAYAAWFFVFFFLLPMFRLSEDAMTPFWSTPVAFGLFFLVVHLTHSWQRLGLLFQKAWRDPSLLSFGLYAVMPIVVLIFNDEVDSLFLLPFALATYAALAGGGVYYLRSRSAQLRWLGLLVGAALSLAISAAVSVMYWSGGAVTPARAGALFSSSLAVLGFLMAPAVIGWAVQMIRRRANPAGG